jgi:hypothetical protein
MGVGCESCHGAAGNHVKAMRANLKGDLQIEKLSTWGATRLNEMCGNCHITAQRIAQNNLPVGDTQRFQPYGLMKSACFKQSNDTLSCSTCHNSHTDAGTDAKPYKATCLKCHSTTPTPIRANAAVVKGKLCPVNSKERCVGCHMPPRKVFTDSLVPTKMADHWIKVVDKK